MVALFGCYTCFAYKQRENKNSKCNSKNCVSLNKPVYLTVSEKLTQIIFDINNENVVDGILGSNQNLSSL